MPTITETEMIQRLNSAFPGRQANELFAVLNAMRDNSALVDNQFTPTDLTAASSLTASQSGSTLYLNSATEFATTLPAAANGLSFEFIVKAAPAGASYTILSASSANIIKGSVYSADLNAAADGDIETSGGDTITIVDAKAVAGDRIRLDCDGTSWHMAAFVSVFDAVTITTAS